MLEGQENNQQQETGVMRFENRFPVRYRWLQGKMYFSLIDVVAALAETDNPNRYWSDLKRKLITEGYEQVYEKIVRLKMLAPDGKMRLTDAVDRETIFRIVQSIPSAKAEPFKLFLAESAEQRLQTLEQTQVDIEGERRKYRLEGRSEEWIEKRIQSILVRNELTQEWDERGARKEDYGVLTNTIAKGTFDLTPQQHKEVKGLKKDNLRDHMTPMELVLTMLGEVTTTELHRDRESEGLPKLQRDAQDGGAVAGRARQDIEKQLGMPVVSSQNFLQEPKKGRRKRQHLAPEGQNPLFLDQGSQNSNF
jgi:DNA-damage-inducible protein D